MNAGDVEPGSNARKSRISNRCELDNSLMLDDRFGSGAALRGRGSNVRYGREAEVSDKNPNVRSWHEAEIPATLIDFRSTPATGHSTERCPLFDGEVCSTSKAQGADVHSG